ncbi:hypothetical protein BJY01DRAFT_224644 [Aspergillus pseudoustus]|uniref:Uncharacterized protein n=1 Tax=Aspergillus pseudoustus TaxID=1810923 RepID=A0ABR4J4X9_9EURO
MTTGWCLIHPTVASWNFLSLRPYLLFSNSVPSDPLTLFESASPLPHGLYHPNNPPNSRIDCRLRSLHSQPKSARWTCTYFGYIAFSLLELLSMIIVPQDNPDLFSLFYILFQIPFIFSSRFSLSIPDFPSTSPFLFFSQCRTVCMGSYGFQNETYSKASLQDGAAVD